MVILCIYEKILLHVHLVNNYFVVLHVGDKKVKM